MFIPGKYTARGQVDGRLGIAATANAGPRLVRRRSLACAASFAASTSTRASSPGTSRRIVRSMRSTTWDRSRESAVRRPPKRPWDGPAGQGGSSRRQSQLLRHRRPTCHGPTCGSNIFPDGGVARLRVYGDVVVDWKRSRAPARAVDLAAIQNGGLVLGASDMHYGAKDNMMMPGRAINMGDGWETRRRRGPGYDWAIVRLGAPGVIDASRDRYEPLQGQLSRQRIHRRCLLPGATLEATDPASWTEMLPQTKLAPHHRHFFAKSCAARPGLARPAQHLSGRRRQPFACPWTHCAD